jgi:hypothetical protein
MYDLLYTFTSVNLHTLLACNHRPITTNFPKIFSDIRLAILTSKLNSSTACYVTISKLLRLLIIVMIHLFSHLKSLNHNWHVLYSYKFWRVKFWQIALNLDLAILHFATHPNYWNVCIHVTPMFNYWLL